MATNTTPIYALPWPDGAERVMDGDNAIKALAERLEAVLGTLVGTIQNLRASGTLALGTGYTLVPGTSTTFGSPVNETAIVTAMFDLNVTTASAGLTCLGSCWLNGAQRPAEAFLTPATTERATVVGVFAMPLTAGSNTIELRARKSVAGGVATAEATNTGFVLQRFRTPGTLLRESLEELEELLAGGTLPA